MTKHLSIVIPAFNEEVNFKRGVLTRLKNFLDKQKYSWEVILVDDGSYENTQSLLSEFANLNKGFKYLRIHHGGKFFAINRGIKEAKGKLILYSDFDFSTPISEVKKMLPLIKKFDVVIAERKRNKKKDVLISKLRNKVFNLLTRLVVLPKIKDTQCGFKLFRAEVAKFVFASTKVTNIRRKGSYMGAFDVELLFLAQKAGYTISSVPVKWRPFKSQRLTFKEPILMLIDIFKIRLYNYAAQMNTNPHRAQQLKYFSKDLDLPGYSLESWKVSYLKKIKKNLVKRDQGLTLLDIATGSGYVAVEMAKLGINVIATDITPIAITNLASYKKKFKLESLRVIKCEAEKLPLAEESCDYIVANAILEHIPKDQKAIKEWIRILKPEGRIFISVPLAFKYIWPFFWLINFFYDKKLGHLRRYTLDELKKKFRLRLVNYYYTGHLIKTFGVIFLQFLLKNHSYDDTLERIDKKYQKKAYGASNLIAVFEKQVRKQKS